MRRFLQISYSEVCEFPILAPHSVLWISVFDSGFGVFINLLLAAFNFLPIGPPDGRKIFNWNPKLGIALLILTGLLLFFGI